MRKRMREEELEDMVAVEAAADGRGRGRAALRRRPRRHRLGRRPVLLVPVQPERPRAARAAGRELRLRRLHPAERAAQRLRQQDLHAVPNETLLNFIPVLPGPD